jgi:pimeloyl-ACP methyl ester carboxylesterase
VILLLHGAGGFPDYQFRFPLIARLCNREGFNAASFVAPYHFQRRPCQRRALNPDCLLLAEATAQAIAEVRALTGWLLGEGFPAVALWGFSMGAWHAGMAVCRDARFAAVVLAMPQAPLNPWIEQRAVWPGIRGRLHRVCGVWEMLNRTAMNLTLEQPAIPKDNTLLIEGIHDLLVPKEDIENFWQAWQRPEIWRLRHGHASLMAAPGLSACVLRWLSPRLNAPVVQGGK